MPRSIWNGAISFGLVNVPVQLFSAVESKDVHFHEFQAGTRSAHRAQAASRERTGREVDYGDIEKGYETARGKYVMLTQEELDSVDAGRSRTIDIEDFVELAEIDPLYFDKPYYRAAERCGEVVRPPAGRDGEQRTRHDDRAFVMRTKQYLAAIRAADKVLVLETLYFGDEIRDPADLHIPSRTKVADRESPHREPADRQPDRRVEAGHRYEDASRERVLDLVRRKGKGQDIEIEAPTERAAEVVDLVEALQRGLDTQEIAIRGAEGDEAPGHSGRPAGGKKAPARTRLRRAG